MDMWWATIKLVEKAIGVIKDTNEVVEAIQTVTDWIRKLSKDNMSNSSGNNNEILVGDRKTQNSRGQNEILKEFYKHTYLTAKSIFNLDNFPKWETNPEIYNVIWPVVVIGYPSDGPLKILERTIQEELHLMGTRDYLTFKNKLDNDLKDAFVIYASMYSMYKLFIDNKYLTENSRQGDTTSLILDVYLEYPKKFLELYRNNNSQLDKTFEELSREENVSNAKDILFRYSFLRLLVTKEILEGKHRNYKYVWRNLQESMYRNVILNNTKLSVALEDGKLWRGLLIDPL